MIITVTLNPAIDRILNVPNFQIGEVNRATKTFINAGGKGINVSKAVKSLGGETLALGFIAGRHGRFIKDMLNSIGIDHHFVEVSGECRVNIKIYCEGTTHTDINEPGFNVSEANFNLLLNRLRGHLREGSLVVISGSTPPDFPVEYYSKLCSTVTEANIPLIIDAEGPRLEHSLTAGPAFVKLNTLQLAEMMGVSVRTPEDALPQARKLIQRGAHGVLVSFLPKGVLYVTSDVAYYAEAPVVNVINSIGIVDVLVGALSLAIEQKMTPEATVKYALAAATASTLIDSSAMAVRRDLLDVYEKIVLRTL
ncbi:MAG: 1-phosphofructokinase family hexose kinase [Clostridiales bacterium]|nr:1-phosphofructokinase family hexose kinase [Clostridiales bacterium]